MSDPKFFEAASFNEQIQMVNVIPELESIISPRNLDALRNQYLCEDEYRLQSFHITNETDLNSLIEKTQNSVKRYFKRDLTNRCSEVINDLPKHLETLQRIIKKGIKIDQILEEYLENPYLVDNKKCTLRIFLLLLSVPLRVAALHRGFLLSACADYKQGEHKLSYSTKQEDQAMHADYAALRHKLALPVETLDAGLSPLFWEKVKASACSVVKGVLEKVGGGRCGQFSVLALDYFVDWQMQNPVLIRVKEERELKGTGGVQREVMGQLAEDGLRGVMRLNEQYLSKDRTVEFQWCQHLAV